jgi:hypothetical protein
VTPRDCSCRLRERTSGVLNVSNCLSWIVAFVIALVSLAILGTAGWAWVVVFWVGVVIVGLLLVVIAGRRRL